MQKSEEAVPNDYVLLRRLVEGKGLMKRNPRIFFFQSAGVWSLFLLGILLLLFVHNFWLQMANAVFLGFVYVQIGLLAHDAGHLQIAAKRWKNVAMCHICALATGLSANCWMEKHNLHHANPNHEDMDPDIDIPILAFSEQQAREKRGAARWIVRYQSVLFFPILCLTGFSMRVTITKFLLKHRGRHWLDAVLFVGHMILYAGVIFYSLPVLQGVLFILIHQMVWGFYMGMIFAPNHKGMLIVGKNEKMDFLRAQVLTARNVKPHPLVGLWYGGLNFQIEHHLFPFMPRYNLPKARPLVKEFCEQRGVPYYETGMVRSYKEILAYMHHISSFA